MFSSGRGGIEQASLDYCELMHHQGHEVAAMLTVNAEILPDFETRGIPCFKLANAYEWDLFIPRKIRAYLQEWKPDIIICHGNRAISMTRKAAQKQIPVIGVAHNYSLDRFADLDAMIAPTNDLAHALELKGIPAERIHQVPHMIQLGGGFIKKTRKGVPVIGTMGRFVAKKGFDVFIEALALLKGRGLEFRAVLGGDGDEKRKLQKLAEKHKVIDVLQFIGWVEDKKQFFNSIDIFCLPSLHEPFGIVVLEAMAHKVPLLSSDSEGPSEIITHTQTGVLVQKGNAQALADGLQAMIEDEVYCRELAGHAFDMLRQRYAMPVVAEQMDKTLQHIIAAHADAALATA